ncbi:MAG TPA: hypothetical protein VLC55_04315 [Burkholderiales bacterium]|nr:hypothetical protein [Burkholderiales bacterium]
MNSSHGPRLGPENPWPGLGAFTEEDRDYFHGRDGETAELVRLVRREPLTVLFGRSGLGKTSLLGAGLFPRLREDGYFPVLIRLSYATPTPLSAQVQDALLAACTASKLEGPPPLPGATLWQFFQRTGAGFWNARNRPVTPVLVLDQFEEMFTLGEEDEDSRRRSEAFLEELGDLIENRPSAAVRQALDADPESISGYDFQRRGCKVVLSFREDFLAQMEGLKHRIPSLMRNRYRLQPMNGAQAYEVVTASGGHLVDEDVARSIVGLAWHNIAEPPPDPAEYPGMEVDPALLSVICSELNLKRQRAGREHITADQLAGAEREILTDFYERAFSGLDPRVRAFVEDELITDRGYRDSYALEDALELPGVSREAIDRLVAGRLLRVDERFGVRRLELTHDVLTRVVKESRDSRKAREAEAAVLARERAAAEQQRKNQLFALGVLLVGAVVLVVGALAVAFWIRAEELLEQAKATDLIISARSVRDDKLDLALLLGAEASRDYTSRVDGQVDLMGVLLANSQLVALLRTEEGQTSHAFSPDGKTLAVGTADGNVALWSTETWAVLRTWKAHETSNAPTVPVTAVAFSRDGIRLATADAKSIALWRLPEGDVVARMELQWSLVSPARLAFSPDGSSIAVESSRGEVGLWHVGGEDSKSRLEMVTVPGRGQTRKVSCLGFAPDGAVLAVGLAMGKGPGVVVRWDVGAGQWLPSDLKYEDMLGFSPDCELVAVRHRSEPGSGTVRVHVTKVTDVSGNSLLAEIEQPNVKQVRFSPDGRYLALAEWGQEGKVHVYDARTGRGGSSQADPIEAGGRVDGLSFSPDGKTLAIALEDGTLVARDWEAGRLKLEAGTSRRIGEVIFTPDGSMLMALPRNRGVDRLNAVWGLERGEMLIHGITQRLVNTVENIVGLLHSGRKRSEVLMYPDGTPHESREVEFNHGGDILASAGADGRAYFWNTQSKKLLRSEDDFIQAEFSPDGTKLAIARSTRNVVQISDASATEPEAEIDLKDQGGVSSLAFSWDNRKLAIGFEDGSVAIYGLDTKPPTALLQAVKRHKGGETQVAFSPHGTILASAGAEGHVAIWNGADGWKAAEAVSKTRRVASIRRLAFSPDGKLLAAGDRDGTVVLYEVDSRKEVAEFVPHDDGIKNVADDPLSVVFIEDGRALVWGPAKQGARDVWDVPGRRWLTTLHSPGGNAGSLALSPKQRRIALRHDDGQVTLREWDPETLVREACRIANRNLTCVEWRQYMRDRPYRKTCEALPGPGSCQ